MPFVDVWVDDREVLRDISDDAMLNELKSRRVPVPKKLMDSIADALLVAWESRDEKEFRDLVEEIVASSRENYTTRRERVRKMYETWRREAVAHA